LSGPGRGRKPRHALYSAPTSEAAPKGRAKSRLGKLILVPLDPEMHLKLRHRALDEGRTVEAFVQAAIADYLSKPASMPLKDALLRTGRIPP
jgi:hypothetical protein